MTTGRINQVAFTSPLVSRPSVANSNESSRGKAALQSSGSHFGLFAKQFPAFRLAPGSFSLFLASP